jgi:hypothetical protein
MATKNIQSSDDNKVDGWEKEEISELEQMKIKMGELEKQLMQALGNLNEKEEVSKEEYPRDIRQDEYISVMSLLPYTLNLSTQGMGKGKIKKFKNFGEIKRILYSELVDIMEAHSNFVNAGYFYIMDQDVVRKHGLDDVYENILDKEKIEKILETKAEKCIDLYKTANPKQQEIIIRLLISKMKDNPGDVNLNVIDKISKISNVDIQEKVRDSIAFSEVLVNEKK